MLLQLDQAGGRQQAVLAAVPRTWWLQGFRCRATAFSIHWSFLLFLQCTFSLLSSSSRHIPSAHPARPPQFQLHVLFIADDDLIFFFLTLKNTNGISEYLKREGKGTSMDLLGHLSRGEGNYFSTIIFSCTAGQLCPLTGTLSPRGCLLPIPRSLHPSKPSS